MRPTGGHVRGWAELERLRFTKSPTNINQVTTTTLTPCWVFHWCRRDSQSQSESRCCQAADGDGDGDGDAGPVIMTTDHKMQPWMRPQSASRVMQRLWRWLPGIRISPDPATLLQCTVLDVGLIHAAHAPNANENETECEKQKSYVQNAKQYHHKNAAQVAHIRE